MSELLSTSQAARILGVATSRVRELARASGLRRAPDADGGRYHFTFQDLVVLRSARRLMDGGLRRARVHRALDRLSAEVGDRRALSELRIFADGAEVAVRDERYSWNVETGQGILDFAPQARKPRTNELEQARSRRAAGGLLTQAHAELARGIELEDADPAGAAEAYSRALDLDPGLIDAYVNLGRIAHDAGDSREAVRIFELALELSPHDPVLHFCQALALEDAFGPVPAISHYEKVIEIDPDYADAHFNLAGLYRQQGRSVDALRHYRIYKELTE